MIQKIGYLILLLALGGGCGQANREYYVKHVRFPEGASHRGSYEEDKPLS